VDLLDPDTGRPGLIAAAAIVAAGMVYYWLVLARDPDYALRGPASE
jgi:hypothetical protein